MWLCGCVAVEGPRTNAGAAGAAAAAVKHLGRLANGRKGGSFVPQALDPAVDLLAQRPGVRAGKDVVEPRAIGGSEGTLSEIAIGLKLGKTVVSLESWFCHPRIVRAESVKEAVSIAENELD